MFNQNQIPTHGFILKKWKQIGYRATALAYLQREDLFTIENTNGKWYSLIEIQTAIINKM
jgi:hypothetical protein